MEQIKSSVRRFILEEVLPGEDPANLHDDTELVTGGILDSLTTLKLVAHLEDQFKVRFQAHETGTQYMNTIDSIDALVQSKIGGSGS